MQGEDEQVSEDTRPPSPDEEARQDLVRWCNEHQLPVPPPDSGSEAGGVGTVEPALSG